MKFIADKNMSDAKLDQRRGFFSKIENFGNAMTQPASFFSLLAGGMALSLLLPAIPHIMLFTPCGAAFVSIGARGVGWFGKSEVDDIRKERAAALQQSQAGPAEDTAPPGVAKLPDLSEVFGQGVKNAVTMKTLRYNTSPSAFLS